MDIFESKKALILSFLPFTGGRFLGNCLALSKDVCPQNPQAAEHLLNHPTDYDYRLEVVLKTLPSPDNMHRWQYFEHRDQNLYGRGCFNMWMQGFRGKANYITERICHSDMHFLINDHSMRPFGLCKVWPNATIVCLINASKFQDISLRKKQPADTPIRVDDPFWFNGPFMYEKYTAVRGPGWPDWEVFQQSGYDVTKLGDLDQGVVEQIGRYYPLHRLQNEVIIYDVDNSYFDTDAFLLSVKSLYQKLGLTDFSAKLVQQFYQKYASLHYSFNLWIYMFLL